MVGGERRGGGGGGGEERARATARSSSSSFGLLLALPCCGYDALSCHLSHCVCLCAHRERLRSSLSEQEQEEGVASGWGRSGDDGYLNAAGAAAPTTCPRTRQHLLPLCVCGACVCVLAHRCRDDYMARSVCGWGGLGWHRRECRQRLTTAASIGY